MSCVDFSFCSVVSDISARNIEGDILTSSSSPNSNFGFRGALTFDFCFILTFPFDLLVDVGGSGCVWVAGDVWDRVGELIDILNAVMC